MSYCVSVCNLRSRFPLDYTKVPGKVYLFIFWKDTLTLLISFTISFIKMGIGGSTNIPSPPSSIPQVIKIEVPW